MKFSDITFTFPGGAQLRAESLSSKAYEKADWRNGVNIWNHYVATVPTVYDAICTSHPQWPALFREAHCLGDMTTFANAPAHPISIGQLSVDIGSSMIVSGLLIMEPWGGLVLAGYLGLAAVSHKLTLWKHTPHIVHKFARLAATSAVIGVTGMLAPAAFIKWVAMGCGLWSGLTSAVRGWDERRAEPERHPQRPAEAGIATKLIADGPQTMRELTATHPEIVEDALNIWLPDQLAKVRKRTERFADEYEAAPAQHVLAALSENERRRLLDATRVFLPQARRAIDGLDILKTQRHTLSLANRLERAIALVEPL